MFKWRFNGIFLLWQWWNKDLVTPLRRNFNKKWWEVNEELLHTLKLVLSAILFDKYLEIRINIGIDNMLLFYGFDSDIFCSID